MCVEPQANVRGFLGHLPLYLLGQGLSLNLELTDSAGRAEQQAQGHLCPHLLSPGLQACTVSHGL